MFQQAVYGSLPDPEREKVLNDLREYCSLDSEGMANLVNELRKIAG